MPIDLCREEIDLHLRYKGVYQHSNIAANTSFAVIYMYNQRSKKYEKLGATVSLFFALVGFTLFDHLYRK